MRLYLRKKSRPKPIRSGEAGLTFLETLIALAILGAIAVPFLMGLATSSKAAFIGDQHATAESLARSQMEWIKNSEYVYDATQYSAAPMPNSGDYTNFSVEISAEPLHSPDGGIQKITVTVKHADKGITTLESYKVDR